MVSFADAVKANAKIDIPTIDIPKFKTPPFSV